MDLDKRYINQIEVIVNAFTIDRNSLKVYLIKRKEEPYKGYWMLPSNLLMTSETIEQCAFDTLYEFIGIKNAYLKQCHVFSEVGRLPNDRIIGISTIALIDDLELSLNNVKTKYDGKWFLIDEIPKMVFDHNDILKDTTIFLKEKLKDIVYLKKLFPRDFTLSELQVFYEQILNKKLDRRNFRKKILSLDLIVDTGYKTNKKTGRPATLYRFNDNIMKIF